jgi:hypothetical protein
MTLRIRIQGQENEEKTAHLRAFFQFYNKKVLWIRIRIGSGFDDFVDPDPDRAKPLDPDPN